MIDNREDILKILQEYSSNVYHNYVTDYKDGKYPKCSYKLSTNYDDDYRDGEPTINIGEYTVQVFEKTVNGKLIEIHKDILKRFKSEGYKQIGFDYFKDNEDNIHIYTFRFRKINLY